MIEGLATILRFHVARVFLILATLFCFSPFIALADSVEEDYQLLFDGQTLKGWSYIGKPGGEYFVSNGVIVCPEVSKGNLVTDKEYGDFSLRLEYKFESNGNNGVAIRAPMSTENLTYVGVEIQMLDDTAPMHRNLKPWQYNGSVYGIVAATNGTAKIGKWNTEEIECIGRNYRITLNGREIVHTDLNEVTNLETMQAHPGMFRLRGHLGFLGHDSHFEFRNIRIKELDKPEKDNVPPSRFHTLAGAKGELTLEKREVIQVGTNVFPNDGNVEWVFDAKREPGSVAEIHLRGGDYLYFGDSFLTNAAGSSERTGALSDGRKSSSSGRRFWNPPAAAVEKSAGEWNHFHVLILGQKTHVFLNGQLIQNNVSLDPGEANDVPGETEDHLLFCGRDGIVKFKNIYTRGIK